MTGCSYDRCRASGSAATRAPTRSAGELLQRGLPLDAHDPPLAHLLGAERAIEIDGGLVPVEHRPVDAAEAFAQRSRAQLAEERAADAAAPLARQHEEIFEVDPGAAEPGRVVVEPQREADRRA